MTYRLEIFDTYGRRISVFTEVPLVEAVRRGPDQRDSVRGILPTSVANVSHGYRIKVFMDERLFCDVPVTEVVPQWSDTRKLILDQYVRFHEVIEFLAEGDLAAGNSTVSRAYANQSIGAIVKDAINSARGAIHYTVAHAAYPQGAEREYLKFLARKTPDNELEIGGIAAGQWVGGARVDTSSAYAKDGDTIAGLVVDGAAWPDVRLLMIDCEESSRNSHAIGRHPEVADWTNAQYDASGYKLAADAATDALQSLMDTHGIDYIELNPHKDSLGDYDDRVDVYGRYICVVYGGGQCFNAAQVELGHADVYLYQDGRYHDPAMALKEYYSYLGEHDDSIEDAPTALIAYDTSVGVLEALTALAYAAGGYVWSVDESLAVRFYKAVRPARVWFFDPVRMGVSIGSNRTGLANAIYFDGNPISGSVSKTYSRGESIDEYGFEGRSLEHFGISREEDADKLMAGVLDDVPYPERVGQVDFFHGNADVTVGDLVELRGGQLRRIERELDYEWGGRFAGRLMGRVKEVAHRFSGAVVSTRVELTSPLRTVAAPLTFMVRSQPSGSAVFQFRLDDAGVGLDGVHHLD
jgi:endonuclease YncB( thermonuclease family)